MHLLNSIKARTLERLASPPLTTGTTDTPSVTAGGVA